MESMNRRFDGLSARMMSLEGHASPSAGDEQEDDSPLELEQWGRPTSDTYPTRGREPRSVSLRLELLRTRPAPARNYMGVRSAQFEQADEDPPENYHRQEPIADDSPHNVRPDATEVVNDLWDK